MTGFYMFKFMWLAQRKKLVPIITAFLHAADAEIMWRVQLRKTLRELRRQVKIWDKIKIPVQLDTKGQVFVTLSHRKEEKFSAEDHPFANCTEPRIKKRGGCDPSQ